MKTLDTVSVNKNKHTIHVTYSMPEVCGTLMKLEEGSFVITPSDWLGLINLTSTSFELNVEENITTNTRNATVEISSYLNGDKCDANKIIIPIEQTTASTVTCDCNNLIKGDGLPTGKIGADTVTTYTAYTFDSSCKSDFTFSVTGNYGSTGKTDTSFTLATTQNQSEDENKIIITPSYKGSPCSGKEVTITQMGKQISLPCCNYLTKAAEETVDKNGNEQFKIYSLSDINCGNKFTLHVWVNGIEDTNVVTNLRREGSNLYVTIASNPNENSRTIKIKLKYNGIDCDEDKTITLTQAGGSPVPPGPTILTCDDFECYTDDCIISGVSKESQEVTIYRAVGGADLEGLLIASDPETALTESIFEGDELKVTITSNTGTNERPIHISAYTVDDVLDITTQCEDKSLIIYQYGTNVGPTPGYSGCNDAQTNQILTFDENGFVIDSMGDITTYKQGWAFRYPLSLDNNFRVTGDTESWWHKGASADTSHRYVIISGVSSAESSTERVAEIGLEYNPDPNDESGWASCGIYGICRILQKDNRCDKNNIRVIINSIELEACGSNTGNTKPKWISIGYITAQSCNITEAFKKKIRFMIDGLPQDQYRINWENGENVWSLELNYDCNPTEDDITYGVTVDYSGDTVEIISATTLTQPHLIGFTGMINNTPIKESGENDHVLVSMLSWHDIKENTGITLTSGSDWLKNVQLKENHGVSGHVYTYELVCSADMFFSGTGDSEVRQATVVISGTPYEYSCCNEAIQKEIIVKQNSGVINNVIEEGFEIPVSGTTEDEWFDVAKVEFSFQMGSAHWGDFYAALNIDDARYQDPDSGFSLDWIGQGDINVSSFLDPTHSGDTSIIQVRNIEENTTGNERYAIIDFYYKDDSSPCATIVITQLG